MVKDIDSALDSLLDQYLKNWGPIEWRLELSRSSPKVDINLGRALLALSAIETDSRVIYRKLHMANLDKRRAIQTFNITWLAEEAEHGRALQCLAGKLGVCDDPWTRSRITIRPLEWPVLAMSRVLGASFEGAYLALGAIQEYVALTTYRKIADIIDDPPAALVLRRIAAQEGRHMHFYRGAALLFLEDPNCAYVASRILRKVWRPPGIDLLGLPAWLASFGPLLEYDDYRARLVRVDSLIRKMPGFEGTSFMAQFLERHGYGTVPMHEYSEIRQAVSG